MSQGNRTEDFYGPWPHMPPLPRPPKVICYVCRTVMTEYFTHCAQHACTKTDCWRYAVRRPGDRMAIYDSFDGDKLPYAIFRQPLGNPYYVPPEFCKPSFTLNPAYLQDKGVIFVEEDPREGGRDVGLIPDNRDQYGRPCFEYEFMKYDDDDDQSYDSDSD